MPKMLRIIKRRLKDLMKTAPDDARVAIFRIVHGEAYVRARENTLREHEAPFLKSCFFSSVETCMNREFTPGP